MFVGIYVVAVELHGKPAASGMIHPDIPTTADPEVVPLRNDMDQPPVRCKAVDRFGRAVGRMIVDHDQIEFKSGLLLQHRSDRICDRPYPLRTGMITEASHPKPSAANSSSRNVGSR